MRILWILPYSPWPTTSGGKTRQYHLLRSLAARGHRITVLLHSKQPVSAEDRQALEPFLERLVVLPRRPLRSLSPLLAALFAPYPLPVSYTHLDVYKRQTWWEPFMARKGLYLGGSALLLAVVLLLVFWGRPADAEIQVLKAPRAVVWKDFLGVNAQFLWFSPERYNKQIDVYKRQGLR